MKKTIYSFDVCVCVCVCVSRTPPGVLGDRSVFEWCVFQPLSFLCRREAELENDSGCKLILGQISDVLYIISGNAESPLANSITVYGNTSFSLTSIPESVLKLHTWQVTLATVLLIQVIVRLNNHS